MPIELDLTSDALDDETLQAIALDLNRALRDADGVQSEVAHDAAIQGDRGGALVVGRILMEVLKSSAAAALIETLGAYFNREKSLKGTINLPNGTVIEIDSKNLRSQEFEQALQAMLAKTAQS